MRSFAHPLQRSGYEFRAACEMVQNGVIGKVKYVENQFGGPACPRRPYKDFKKRLYASRNQVQNFVECVTARTDTISNHHVGPWTSVLCQLVHMSYVHDTGFDWNPAKMTFANGTGKIDWLSRVEIRPNAHRFEVKA